MCLASLDNPQLCRVLAYGLIYKPNLGGWCFLYIIDTGLEVCRDVRTDDGITNMIVGLSADHTLL